MTKLEYGIIAAIVAILGALAAGAVRRVDEKKAFLAECQQHEKAYECEVKWKQMHPDPQHVVVTGWVAR